MATGKLKEFIDKVNAWANYEFDDVLVTSWIRMAESRLSEALRCQDMVNIIPMGVTNGFADLPGDYQEIDFVRRYDGGPMEYVPRHELYSGPKDFNQYSYTGNYFLTNTNFVPESGMDPETFDIELTYFASIPALDISSSWLYDKYEWLFLPTVLGFSSVFNIEDDRAGLFSSAVVDGIATINDTYSAKKARGSVLVPKKRIRGF